MRIRRLRCSATDGMLNLTVSFDLLMDTISHLFVCLPTLELTTFEQELCLTKNRLQKYTIIGDKQLEKKEHGHLEQRSAHQASSGSLVSLH